jgi:putative flippase GtrA
MNLALESRRFVKFLIVGTIGAVVDFGVFNLLTVLLHLPPLIAQAVSFLTAVTSNFLFNRYWTYPDSRSKPIWHQAVQFTVVNSVGLGIRTPLFHFLIPVWQDFLARQGMVVPASFEQLAGNLSLACAVLVVLVWNFVVNRIWTYNDVR